MHAIIKMNSCLKGCVTFYLDSSIFTTAQAAVPLKELLGDSGIQLHARGNRV